MTELPSKQPPVSAAKMILDVVENDLKLAMTFTKISSAAYSAGRLQHASDAHSKAQAAHARAVAEWKASSAVNIQEAASVQLMLNEVQAALSSLPASAHQAMWMFRAAG
jgi:hypothetical protein